MHHGRSDRIVIHAVQRDASGADDGSSDQHDDNAIRRRDNGSRGHSGRYSRNLWHGRRNG